MDTIQLNVSQSGSTEVQNICLGLAWVSWGEIESILLEFGVKKGKKETLSTKLIEVGIDSLFLGFLDYVQYDIH